MTDPTPHFIDPSTRVVGPALVMHVAPEGSRCRAKVVLIATCQESGWTLRQHRTLVLGDQMLLPSRPLGDGQGPYAVVIDMLWTLGYKGEDSLKTMLAEAIPDDDGVLQIVYYAQLAPDFTSINPDARWVETSADAPTPGPKFPRNTNPTQYWMGCGMEDAYFGAASTV